MHEPHKRLADEQVQVLFRRCFRGLLWRSQVQDMVDTGEARFFARLREDHSLLASSARLDLSSRSVVRRLCKVTSLDLRRALQACPEQSEGSAIVRASSTFCRSA